jgi:glycosyltransferase involved in cell wall biosynthesis
MKHRRALLVFFHGKSNAGGTERVVQYLDEYLIDKGLETIIIDEVFLMNTSVGRWYKKIFNFKHFAKRKRIYLARFASAYLWLNKRKDTLVFSNGESVPFYPVDFVMNHGCYHTMELDYGRTKPKLSRTANLQRLGCVRGKEIVTVAEKVKEDLITHYKVPASKIKVVSNPVNSDYFLPLKKEKTDIKTIVYIGRLEVGKGLKNLQLLAKIIKQTDGWRLLIASNNNSNSELFSDYENTNVKVSLTIENINEEAYSKADLVFYPSLSESFGLVTIEALSTGVPVVATAVGIVPDLLERSFPGVYLLPKFEDDSILEYFKNIIDTFTETIDREALHELVKNEFGIPGFRKNMDKAIGNLL